MQVKKAHVNPRRKGSKKVLRLFMSDINERIENNLFNAVVWPVCSAIQYTLKI